MEFFSYIKFNFIYSLLSSLQGRPSPMVSQWSESFEPTTLIRFSFRPADHLGDWCPEKCITQPQSIFGTVAHFAAARGKVV